MKADLVSGTLVRVRPIGALAQEPPGLGIIDGDEVFAVDGSLAEIHAAQKKGSLHRGPSLGSLSELELLAPVTPSKIICVGLNYLRHAEEMNKPVPDEPLIFSKPPSAIIGPGEAILLPAQSQEVHHEGELAIIIGERLKDATREQSHQAILGYTCACDVTARDIQRREQRYTRAKGFDTFLPLGPAIALASGFEPSQAHLSSHVGDQLRQQSRLDDFIFSIEEVLSFISSVMTLVPGDLILTGTPHGVGPILHGETLRVTISGIGTLENPVLRP